ncbi:MAG: MFS transporter [Candidatus Limnocylindrales bacterium]
MTSVAAIAGRGGAFLGWRMVALATITAALTGPGQTIGVSVFVDPMITALSLTRSEVSTAYLIGTLLGAAALLPVGRFIDRVGASAAMTWVGLALGAGLLAMSGVGGFVTLALGFTLIRWLGQGSLQLVSTLSVTPWFERRRGFAFGIMTTASATLMALTPVLLGAAIGAYGWRVAWVLAAVAIWLVVVPIARWGIIDRPSDVGQWPDGDPAPLPDDPRSAESERPSLSRAEALRQPRFWVLSSVIAATSMLITALNFHQISILGAQGLSVTEAAAMFLPQVVGAIVAGVVMGALTDRLPASALLAATMALLVLSLVLAVYLRPGPIILLYAIILGAAGGAGRPVVATVLPRWYGLANIGAIQGVSMLVGVAASASGPVALSLARDGLGGYGPAAWLFVAIPIAIGLAALAIRDPELERASARTAT